MDVLRFYTDIQKQNDLYRLLYEDINSNLFLWLDSNKILRKIQFEIQNTYVLEMDELGVVYSKLVSDEMLEEGEGLAMYGRAFSSRVEKEVFADVLKDLDSNEHRESIAKCKEMMQEGRLRPIHYQIDLPFSVSA